MRDIHPHWEAEEDLPVEVRVVEKEENGKEPEPTPDQPFDGNVVSRRPAAVVGMLVVLGIGITFFQGLDRLTGQVAPSGPTVRITEEGVMPPTLNVEHGDTITFVNETDDQQIISSATLCSDTGFCLQTDQLGRGQSDNFTITPDMRSGKYEYASNLSSDIRGSIVIVTQVSDEFVDSTSVLQDNFLNELVSQNPSPFAEEIPSAFGATAGIPQNPYTVGSEQPTTFENSSPPRPAAMEAQTVLTQTRGPMRQPETGAQHWVVIGLSVALLWRLTRHQFAVSR